MPRPRFQFRLSTLLWITLAVACWFGGMAWETHLQNTKWPDEVNPRHRDFLKFLDSLPEEYRKVLDRVPVDDDS